MSNGWPIQVKSCRDCPLLIDGHMCGARQFMSYLGEERDQDVSESVADGTPPPMGCPLENGDCYVTIDLHKSARRCCYCRRAYEECPLRVAIKQRLVGEARNQATDACTHAGRHIATHESW